MSSEKNKAIKDTAKHGMIYGIGQVIPQAVGFLLLPILARYLSTDEFGIWALLQSIILISISVFSVGLDTSCMRSYYDYDEQKSQKSIVGNSVLILLTIIALFNLLTQPAAEFLSALVFKTADNTLFLRMILITASFRLLNSIPFVLFRAKHKSKLYITIQATFIISRLSLMIFFLVVLKYGLLGIVLADMIITGAETFVLYFFIRHDITLGFNASFSKELLVFGIPLIPGRFFNALVNNIDRYFLAYYLSFSSVGIYFVGMKIAQILTLVITRPMQLIFPAVAFSIHKKSFATDYYKRTFTYYVFIGFFICLSLSLFSKEILLLMGKEEFLAANNLIPFLLLSFLAAGLQQNLQVTLFVERKTFWVPIIVFVGCVINVVMNITLIPTLFLFGAAISKLLTSLSIATLWYYISRKYNKINYEWGRIFKIILTSIALYLPGRFISISNIYFDIPIKLIFISLFPFLLLLQNFYYEDEKKQISKYCNKYRKILKLKAA